MRAGALVLLAACSSAPAASYVGKPCGITGPTECGGGTTCMPQAAVMNLTLPDGGSAPGCSAMNQACTIACATDADCTKALGPGFRCETRCANVAPSQCVGQ